MSSRQATADGRHLVLIGLMGSGKTTVGRMCAAALSRDLIDTDELVEAAAGASVAEVFAADGEAVFRALERQAVADACAAPRPSVIACGGGAVLDPDNRRRLRESGVVVWLRASSSVLAARVAPGGAERTRPLLEGAPALGTLERLATVREPAYAAAAHVRVDTEDRTPAQVADAVLEEYQRCAA